MQRPSHICNYFRKAFNFAAMQDRQDSWPEVLRCDSLLLPRVDRIIDKAFFGLWDGNEPKDPTFV